MISIVIPTYKERFLKDTIETIIANTRENYEIIVVSSSPELDSFVKDYGAVLLEAPKGYAGEARNIGAREARGDVLVFVDSHVWVPKGWEKVTYHALKSDVGIVTSAVYVVDTNGVHHKEQVGYFPICYSNLEFGWGRPPSASEAYEVQAPVGCFHVVERKKFLGQPAGYIPYWGYEDRELALRFFRLGYKNILVPDVKVGHMFKHSSGPVSLSNFWYLYAKNYYIGSLLDFDDKTLSRLKNTLKSKGVTEEIKKEVVSERKWLALRNYYLETYKLPDTLWFKTFGVEPP
ncbi:MAG: glycosyltransferase family 2 protein [Thermoproteota archaeon]|jgi:glycosyltransferase involved in cell wall biosynthesis